ncbi:speckle-type POZ protein B-like isoform X11 [Planococcus citri]|uniref:speckle-type POZ protein B-like isoform X11 n=1 Tax=Planococcus citri TaxID=170843 RepID=UPI0031F9E6CA
MSSSLYDSFCKSSGCKTKIHYHIASYVWTIEDFHFHEAKGERLVSPVFSSVTNNQVKWYLSLTPNNGKNDAKDFVSLFLYMSEHSSLEKGEKVFVETTFYILNGKGEEEFHQTPPIEEFVHLTSWGYVEFVKKDAKFRNKMLSNKALTIRCDVKFSDMNDISEECHQRDCSMEVRECNLSENLASLFENQEFTDVVLSVNGKDFPAHKNILAARSAVFRAMFTHSTKEKELNRVDIEDISEQVVDEMLKYIYTGKCLNIKKFAGGLLAAADKYDLYQLKTMCAKTLFEGLSVENAASILTLADMHGAKELKNKVIKFIVSNPTEVMGTEGWKNIRSNFELADEVCLAIAKQLKKTTN